MNRKQVKELAETNATYMFDKATKLYGEYTDEYVRHFYNKLAELRSGIDDVHTCNCTNADRIRNMSDEELAVSITCPAEYDLNFNKECGCNGEMNRNCRKCTLNWLQSEAE